MRIPVLDNKENIPKKPATQSRVLNQHKRNTTDHTIQRECNTSTDSSDLESEWPARHYRKLMEKLIQRRERHSADGSEQLEVISPSEDSHSERDNFPVKHVPYNTQEKFSEPISSEDEQPPLSCSNVHVTPKLNRPKR